MDDSAPVMDYSGITFLDDDTPIGPMPAPTAPATAAPATAYFEVSEGFSSDFGCVCTFTPLLNETGRICLKTAHVAATNFGVLTMCVPFRSAPAYRPRQPVAGRAEGPGRCRGRGRGWRRTVGIALHHHLGEVGGAAPGGLAHMEGLEALAIEHVHVARPRCVLPAQGEAAQTRLLHAQPPLQVPRPVDECGLGHGAQPQRHHGVTVRVGLRCDLVGREIGEVLRFQALDAILTAPAQRALDHLGGLLHVVLSRLVGRKGRRVARWWCVVRRGVW